LINKQLLILGELFLTSTLLSLMLSIKYQIQLMPILTEQDLVT